MLGENVLQLAEPNGAAELIAVTIGTREAVIDVDQGVQHLTGLGVDPAVQRAVATALATQSGRGLARVKGALSGLGGGRGRMRRLWHGATRSLRVALTPRSPLPQVGEGAGTLSTRLLKIRPLTEAVMSWDRRAYILAGLGYGDEGKGAWTDFLARTEPVHTVVRFNGGAQAGHNVITPDGRHHTFAQFGSGTFVRGVNTHLSRFMLVNPLRSAEERRTRRPRRDRCAGPPQH